MLASIFRIAVVALAATAASGSFAQTAEEGPVTASPQLTASVPDNYGLFPAPDVRDASVSTWGNYFNRVTSIGIAQSLCDRDGFTDRRNALTDLINADLQRLEAHKPKARERKVLVWEQEERLRFKAFVKRLTFVPCRDDATVLAGPTTGAFRVAVGGRKLGPRSPATPGKDFGGYTYPYTPQVGMLFEALLRTCNEAHFNDLKAAIIESLDTLFDPIGNVDRTAAKEALDRIRFTPCPEPKDATVTAAKEGGGSGTATAAGGQQPAPKPDSASGESAPPAETPPAETPKQEAESESGGGDEVLPGMDRPIGDSKDVDPFDSGRGSEDIVDLGTELEPIGSLVDDPDGEIAALMSSEGEPATALLEADSYAALAQTHDPQCSAGGDQGPVPLRFAWEPGGKLQVWFGQSPHPISTAIDDDGAFNLTGPVVTLTGTLTRSTTLVGILVGEGAMTWSYNVKPRPWQCAYSWRTLPDEEQQGAAAAEG